MQGIAMASRRKNRLVTAREPNGCMLVSDVENRMLRACKTIRALPDKDRKFQMIANTWPDTIQDTADAYGYTEALIPRFRPTPADVSDCLIALNWARCLERREFKLVWWRSFGISFRHIGLRLGRSDELARQRYRDAILRIWYEANQQRSAECVELND
jgi:Domain of unknown function (DUF6362)